MHTHRFALVSALGFAGCLGSATVDPTSQRIVTGKVVANAYQLDNPVMIAESSDHRLFVTHLFKDGSFRLELPSNVAYRLTLANSTRSAAGYVAVARVNWPIASGPSRWAKLSSGAALDLGHVFTRGSTQWTIQCSGCSGSGGGYDSDQGSDCHEDDHSYCGKSSQENDCDTDHKYKDDDGCDKDDDADQHDKDCDKDDHDKEYGDGGGDDHGDDDHSSSSCDGGSSGSSSGSGGSYGSGGSVGAGCATNADCAVGLDCIASYCVPIK